MELTQEYIKSILSYDPETGIFRYIKRTAQRIQIGDIAGTMDHDYLRICINGKRYYLHRLAYFYMTGKWVEEVDHKDLNKTNNKWSNLRPATSSTNKMNCTLHKDNKTGFKGVSWSKQKSKYRATIFIDKKQKHLGFFFSPELASEAYKKASKEYFKEFHYEGI